VAISRLNFTHSDKQSNVNTTFILVHTVNAAADDLIILVSGLDSSGTDVVCTGVSSDVDGAASEIIGLEQQMVSGDYGHVSIWRIASPTPGAHDITVGFNGKTSNADATAVDLQNVDSEATNNSFTDSSGVITAALGSGDYILGIAIFDDLDPGNISVSTGNEIAEDDLGSMVSSIADRVTTPTLLWTDLDSSDGIAVAISLIESAEVANNVVMNVIGHMG